MRSTDEVLDRAAEIIEQRGWCQGVSALPDGRCCAGWAIRTASNQDESAFNSAANHFFGYIGWRPIHGWNDEPQMTKERVVATLRAAARSARSDE